MFLAPANSNGNSSVSMIVQPGGEADPPMPPPLALTATHLSTQSVHPEQLQPMGESDLPEPPPSSCSPQLPSQRPSQRCPSCSSSTPAEPLLRYDPVDHLRHMGQTMWEQRAFTDVSIVVEGCEIARAHRSILMAASPRIGMMLWHCFKEGEAAAGSEENACPSEPSVVLLPSVNDDDGQPDFSVPEFANISAEEMQSIPATVSSAHGEPVLVFEDADPAAVEAMLRYVYTGSLPKDADLRAVLSLAHAYGIQGLAAHCCHALASEQLTSTNVVEKMRVLRHCSDNDVAQRAYKAMCDRAFEERCLFDALMTNL